MSQPEGTLTPIQYGIMQAVWDSGGEGVTAAEIWEQVSRQRSVGRTTVLKQIQRLEGRRWLRRLPGQGTTHYIAAVNREQTTRMLAGEFVEDFFGGSLSNLVMSVLGTRKIVPEDVNRLKRLLDEHAQRSRTRRGRNETD